MFIGALFKGHEVMRWYWILLIVAAAIVVFVVFLWITIRLASRDWGEPGTVAAAWNRDPFSNS